MSTRESPRKRILELVDERMEGVTRGIVEEQIGVSYWSARYHLEKLVEEGIIKKSVRLEDGLRRIDYYSRKWKYARVKVRLYNETIDPTPTGQFQGFYEVDAVLDGLGLPIRKFRIMDDEIGIAKVDMWRRFNAPFKWLPEQMTLDEYTPGKRREELSGIPFREMKSDRPKYPKGKSIPEEYRGALNIEELIWGISNRLPVDIDTPTGKIIVERLLVIKDKEINWDSGSIEEEISPFGKRTWRVGRPKKEEMPS